ncbi:MULTISPECIES: HI1506-related protein [Serratia]|jgi:septal ring factor EnvC (AmiA/AmiB activator)|uniref:HI1506-related protein n=1 Tax=Serratia TaxID=613 RepID=UPI0027E5B220|nr:HI1506-related protein [Serratia marcescens]MCH4195223.1 HI1506-related protein [Serratia liquefaciens]MCH4231469.1 HI1506-related protein [Serratia liquefaciens]MCH4263126.1 HI1506-related protein [Serratia liquefaciens]MCI1213161.1 HI1506-related protein [Serratia liquefaciens]MCI1234518.1 HI1506-related protein [Serratia liquefaciens]
MPIQITARREGFRRCGIAHSAKTTTYEDGRFTPKQLAELENDPQLVVVRIAAGAATDDQDLDKQLSLARETITRQEQELVTLKSQFDDAQKAIASQQENIAALTTERDDAIANSTALTAELAALKEPPPAKK